MGTGHGDQAWGPDMGTGHGDRTWGPDIHAAELVISAKDLRIKNEIKAYFYVFILALIKRMWMF